LRDVKARLARMEGTEALIEGFGASSGRGVRSLWAGAWSRKVGYRFSDDQALKGVGQRE